MKGWNRYLAATLKYPSEARSLKLAGSIVIVLILDAEGVIDDSQVFNRGENQGSLEKEAFRVIWEYPYRWGPAIAEGVPSETMVRISLRFKLS